jgi:hypothetical protein
LLHPESAATAKQINSLRIRNPLLAGRFARGESSACASAAGSAFLFGSCGTSLLPTMIVHACDGCGVAIRPGTRFTEATCGDCAKEGLPMMAHTVCEMCAERGTDVVRLALLHQISAHGLPEGALEAKPIVLWPWRIRRGSERARAFSAPRPMVVA